VSAAALALVGVILSAVIGWALRQARREGAAAEDARVSAAEAQQLRESMARLQKVADEAGNPPGDDATLGRLRDGSF
jgi:hypothetical protein